jgi:tricorn protease interacting factor F2/3
MSDFSFDYHLIPRNYTLTFEPDLETFIFSGKELITFELSKSTKEIVLDAMDLEVVSCALLEKESSIDCQKRVENNRLYITFPKALKQGTYVVEIIFNGKINEYLAGWYRSRYEVDGELRYCATSHFEPADARRAFPCVDHPSYKATFDIAMVIEKGLVAISNMPEIVVSDKGRHSGERSDARIKGIDSGQARMTGEQVGMTKKKKRVRFAQSPIMSTYLVYLGVGEFEFIEGKYKNVVIRGVTNPGKKAYAKFAVEEAAKYLAYFEEYFGVEYPLPKVDLIAVTDFAAGAMENWGAITFRENAMLFYPDRTSVVTKQHIAEVVAHELAHQWFGNLVTMRWWEDLWLNESFATFMAHKAVDHAYPEWKIWTRYVLEVVFGGMSLDSLRTTHPIQVQVDAVAQTNELFDEIAYEKGGSILRMLEGYLTEEGFRDGLRAYIPKFAYANAEGKNLWETLEVVSKKPVVKLMESFIQQMGFPEVGVRLEGKSLVFSQKRFSFEQQADTELWHVPVCWQDESGVKRELLEAGEEKFALKGVPQFVNANADYSGFYVSAYSDDLAEKLGEHIGEVSVPDRLGFVHDYYFFVLSGSRTVAEFVDFVERYFSAEDEATVLSYLIGKLTSIYLLLETPRLREVASILAKRALQKVSREPVEHEDPEHVILRNTALYALGLFGDAETEQFALEKFQAFLSDETSLHSDLRGTIYALAVWAKDENYSKVLELYKQTPIQEEKAKFLSALARSKNRTLLLQTLDYALSTEVSFSNLVYVFSSLSRNPYAKDLAIDWIRSHWDVMVQSGGGMGDMILRFVLKYIIPQFGVGREDLVYEFLGGVKGVSLQKTFEQLKEELEIHSRLVERNKER